MSREGSVAAPGSGQGRKCSHLRWLCFTPPGSPPSSSLIPHSGPKPHMAQHCHCIALCISVPWLPGQSTTNWVAKQHKFILSQFWRLEVKIKLLAELVPSEGPEGRICSRLKPRLVDGVLHVHMVVSMYTCLSPDFPLL